MKSHVERWIATLSASVCMLLAPAAALAQLPGNWDEPDPGPVCSPWGTDIRPQFDAFYATRWNCTQEETDRMWSDVDLEQNDWLGIGYEDPCNVDRPLGKLFNALQVLKVSSTSPNCNRSLPVHEVNPTYAILDWGYCYVADSLDIQTECSRQDAWAETASFIGDNCELMYGFFNEESVVQRASTLIHEARHAEGPCMHGSNDCKRKASCDESYGGGCSGLGSSSGPGAVSYQVAWLLEYISSLRGKGGIEADLRTYAIDWANVLLDRAFNSDPCFSVDADGRLVDTCNRGSCEDVPGAACF